MSLRISIFISAAALFSSIAAAGEMKLSAVESIDRETLVQMRDDLDGARDDRDDARTYLAELEAGNFAGIFAVADDGSLRCGEVKANPGCAPLTEQDKIEALAEAREALVGATAQLGDAKIELVNVEGVKSAENR